MRVLIIAAGVVILCLTLFFEGLFGKRRGRVAEEAMEDTFRKYERKTDEKGGRFGDVTKRLLAWVRRMGKKSASGGRAVRDKIGG